MKFIFLFLFTLLFSASFADEGMWLPTDIHQLPIAEHGCELSANELYHPDSSSVSNAIVGLGSEGRPFRHFCTAEFISSQGLLMTNHHCGTRMIQEHSKVGANIFNDGFWAHSLKDELPNKGLTASILLSMSDVTDSIFNNLSDTLSDSDRLTVIDSIFDLLVDSVKLNEGEKAQVKSFYEGNKYYLLIYKIYKDVRLVGVPAKSIGKFGGETDNWEWPRHTADFCVLRVYGDSLGNPASFDSTNIPISPKHFLPISKAGVDASDFTFIMGFPGSTHRYVSSAEIKQKTDVNYTERVKVREEKLAVLNKYMSADEDVYIKYYVKNQSIANYYKNFKGQIEAVGFHNVVAKKQAKEQELQAFANCIADSNVFKNEVFDSLFALTDTYTLANAYYTEGLFYASSSFYVAYKFEKLYDALEQTPDSTEAIRKHVENAKAIIEEFFTNFIPHVDQALFQAGLEVSYVSIPEGYRPDYFSTITDKYKADVSLYTEKAYEKSIFISKERLMDFLEKPSAKVLAKDPIFQLAMSTISKLRSIRAEVKDVRTEIKKGKREFTQQILDFHAGENTITYPDANSTLRFTYGHVDGYKPRDAMYYKHFTTVKGIVEKSSSGLKDYFLPDSIRTLLRGHQDIPVCFISTNDITGGNSGSPVMNAKGELIGVAFDGNWEAMSGDILFDPDYQRCINADIRYILFIIEKIGRCNHILNELEIR